MRYRILLHGRNLELIREGKLSTLCFYATRDIEADTTERARQLALANIWEEDQIRACTNAGTDPPRIEVEEIEEIKALEQRNGFTFYEPEDDNPDDAPTTEIDSDSSRGTAYRIEKQANS